MRIRLLMSVGMISLLIGGGRARGDVFISFDANASGQPLNAPAAFDNAGPLREAYAALGVHFAGPGTPTAQGGAILNSSTFVSPAHSGANFLAFSGVEGSEFVGPERVTFDSLMSSVSVFASCLGHPQTFTVQAYDAPGRWLTRTPSARPGLATVN